MTDAICRGGTRAPLDLERDSYNETTTQKNPEGSIFTYPFFLSISMCVVDAHVCVQAWISVCTQVEVQGGCHVSLSIILYPILYPTEPEARHLGQIGWLASEACRISLPPCSLRATGTLAVAILNFYGGAQQTTLPTGPSLWLHILLNKVWKKFKGQGDDSSSKTLNI